MTTGAGSRPSRDEYYMGIALAVRERANCLGSRVGALIVREDRVVSTGYNGTPQDVQNCDEGGCDRCTHRERYGSGKGYDVCICVHAEQNALLAAARFGIAVQDGTLYTTTRPCFGCTKELLQARIKAVYYLHDWRHPDPELAKEYDTLQARFSEGIRTIRMDDPKREWAMPPRNSVPQESGQSIPGIG